MGRGRRKGRDVHGIVLLDKPTGVGSNEALQRVKRLFDAKKAGHTGSLDRLASGLLPLCFGEATKLSSFLLNADKTYTATVSLGVKTTTGDAEGEVVETRPVPRLEPETIEAALAQFRGDIQQVPPMYSALKHRGQRLYKLAHQGITVEREPRGVTIYDLRLLQHVGHDLHIEVTCSKGTYVRTLAEDIGERLGCGAHVGALRRTRAGPYGMDEMLTLADLESQPYDVPSDLDHLLVPMETALGHWPRVSLNKDVAYYIRKGQPVLVPHAPTDGWVKLHGPEQQFMGVGEVLDDGRIAPRRLVNAAR